MLLATKQRQTYSSESSEQCSEDRDLWVPEPTSLPREADAVRT